MVIRREVINFGIKTRRFELLGAENNDKIVQMSRVIKETGQIGEVKTREFNDIITNNE